MCNKEKQDFLEIRERIQIEKNRQVKRFDQSGFDTRILAKIRESGSRTSKYRLSPIKLVFATMILLGIIGFGWYLFFNNIKSSSAITSIELVLRQVAKSNQAAKKPDYLKPMTSFEESLERVIYSVQRKNLNFERLSQNLEQLLSGISNHGWGIDRSGRGKFNTFGVSLINELNKMKKEEDYSPLFSEIIKKIKEVSI